MAYPTPAEVAAAAKGNAVAKLTDDQLEAATEAAIATVEGYCRQRFTFEGTLLAPVERVVSGPGAASLYLPRRLESLVALSIDGRTLRPEDVAIDDRGGALRMLDSAYGGWLVKLRRGAEPPTFDENASVAIAGVWGWPEVPAAVRQAIIADVEDQAAADDGPLAETLGTYRAHNVASASQGDLSVTLRDTASDPGMSARVRRLLAGEDVERGPFRWYGGAAAFA